jgi:hypothetical protein
VSPVIFTKLESPTNEIPLKPCMGFHLVKPKKREKIIGRTIKTTIPRKFGNIKR